LVIRAGIVKVGDVVRIVPLRELPDRVGGWIVGAAYPHALG